jgi:hypothetical protein
MKLATVLSLFALAAFVSVQSTGQTKEGWVKANVDTLVYLSGIADFNSAEIISKTPIKEKEDIWFKYYLGEVVEYSTINGLTGLLTEWGASNAELATLLNNYDYYLNKALREIATSKQQDEFLADNSFIKVVQSRHYFIELLKFAKTYKKVTYQKNMTNASFCLAISLCDRETKRLLALRKAKLQQYERDLNKNKIEARWEGGMLWVGDMAHSAFDDLMEPQLKAYESLNKDIVAEARRSAKKLSLKSVKIARSNEGRFSNDKAKAAFFLSISKLVSPSAYAILSIEQNVSSYVRFARDTSLASLFNDFSTVVHEACHGLNDDKYFISESIIIPVTISEVYNSHELINVIPKEKYQSFFRNDYVFEKSEVSSQVSGIFGLLDEFSAYYNGAKVDWDIVNNRERITQGFPSYLAVAREFSFGQSEWQAYYEFSIMMAWYLDYSKQQYPTQYQMLMDNKSLRVAYSLLHNRFSELVRKVEVRYGKADEKLRALFMESEKTLSQFRIENCTEANYKGFLLP